ncbi:Chorion peroxidase, partial [Armadillidium vulgare]
MTRENSLTVSSAKRSEIADNILTDIDLPDRKTPFGVLIWAQFMEHDLTHTPDNDMEGKTIMCCENGHLVSPKPESCFPILISPEDGVYNSRDQRCINFVRSSFALNEDCTFGPVEQLNVITHWLDGSMIYGSTEATKHKVADLSTGFMRTSANGLPPVIECDAHKKGSTCFLGGVFRINDNPGLLTMYSLWIREHNRIAAILKKLNPHWDSNQLYEETRRIVIAQIQHITYSEWLPIIIGPSLMDKFGINVLRNGYRNSYDPSLDPRIKNEFSTAAFRFGHSLGWRKDFSFDNFDKRNKVNFFSDSCSIYSSYEYSIFLWYHSYIILNIFVKLYTFALH